jgi:hypothetical protein
MLMFEVRHCERSEAISRFPLQAFWHPTFFVGFPQASFGRFGKSAKKQLVAAKGFSFQSGLFESTEGII